MLSCTKKFIYLFYDNIFHLHVFNLPGRSFGTKELQTFFHTYIKIIIKMFMTRFQKLYKQRLLKFQIISGINYYSLIFVNRLSVKMMGKIIC